MPLMRRRQILPPAETTETDNEPSAEPSNTSAAAEHSTPVGDTDEEIAASREHARGMIAFYGSTPNYHFQFDDLGFEGTTGRMLAVIGIQNKSS